MNSSLCEHDEMKERGYEADREFSSDDGRGNMVAFVDSRPVGFVLNLK